MIKPLILDVNGTLTNGLAISIWTEKLNLDIPVGHNLNDLKMPNFMYMSFCQKDPVQKEQDIVKYNCKNNGGQSATKKMIETIFKLKKNSNKPLEQWQ